MFSQLSVCGFIHTSLFIFCQLLPALPQSSSDMSDTAVEALSRMFSLSACYTLTSVLIQLDVFVRNIWGIKLTTHSQERPRTGNKDLGFWPIKSRIKLLLEQYSFHCWPIILFVLYNILSLSWCTHSLHLFLFFFHNE